MPHMQSNPQSQQASCHGLKPLTVRPLGLATNPSYLSKFYNFSIIHQFPVDV
jgi:hypothetical protein